jgi:hypothetical protein
MTHRVIWPNVDGSGGSIFVIFSGKQATIRSTINDIAIDRIWGDPARLPTCSGFPIGFSNRSTIIAVTNGLQATVVPRPPGNLAANADFYCVRRNIGRSAEGHNQVYVLWQAPLGIFGAEDVVLGSGDYRLSLTPDANYALSAIECLNPAAQPSAGAADGTYSIRVKNVIFYASLVKMSIPNSVQELHLREYQVQSRQMTAANLNLSFSVPASTVR